MNADDLDDAYQRALPVINERLAAYQRDGHDHDCQCSSCESRRDERLRTAEPRPSQLSNAAQCDVAPHVPLEEQCRQRWDLEPELRAEFRDNYEAYLAYEKAVANGQVLFREASPPTGTHTQQVAEMLENSTPAPDPVGGVEEQQRENGSPAPDAKDPQG
jgi:hypothetical protein